MDFLNQLLGNRQPPNSPYAQPGAQPVIFVQQDGQQAQREEMTEKSHKEGLENINWKLIIAILCGAALIGIGIGTWIAIRDLSGAGAGSIMQIKEWFETANLSSRRGLTSFFKIVFTAAAFAGALLAVTKLRGDKNR